MADSKYGRIFTENDVHAILDRVGLDNGNEREELLSGGTFGDEPVFVIRAKDRLGLGMVRNYRLCCEARGCKQKHLKSVDTAVKAFEQWRKDNPDKIKDPD